jgi:acyl-CoA-binding protein
MSESVESTEFNAYIDAVRESSIVMSSAVKLRLYAYYKQGSLGDVSGTWGWGLVAKAKFNAWANMRWMSMEDAQTAYVNYAKSIGVRLSGTSSIREHQQTSTNTKQQTPNNNLTE